MNIVAIIQARMGSTRLAGKVLKEINGKSLLEYQIERLKYSKYISKVVIATTTLLRDKPIIDFCKSNNLDYYCGSEDDVLSRYYGAAKYFNGDIILRLTSDCPLIDPSIVDEVTNYYINNQTNYDYVSNTLERTYPRGLDIEVFSFDCLKKAFEEASFKRDREHVTSYFYTNPTIFKLAGIKSGIDYSSFRLTVDTKEDFTLVSLIINKLYKEKSIFYLNDIIQLLKDNPSWVDINNHIEQKKI